jgi:hypothetical protein
MSVMCKLFFLLCQTSCLLCAEGQRLIQNLEHDLLRQDIYIEQGETEVHALLNLGRTEEAYWVSTC